MKRVFLCALALLFSGAGSFQGSLPTTATADTVESVYTDLSQCQTVKVNQERASSITKCPGVGGYHLLILDDDARMSVTVVAPGGKEHPLEYWHTITNGFSTVGQKAEWRVIRQNGKLVPIALIVRVNANEDSEKPEKVTSYLAVAKITGQQICVTNKIKPSARANEEARTAADAAANKPCLE
ncbi:MAG: hypothetical protein K1Y36_11475 [Blastocatellia bacterium]|nr:hypothetical protein [Blastocatellia bacterium]